ncbi:hypothetical protein A2U01_0083377, partial [Trifolium medium]|nr:hypothetical protein [Trifolium medium]
MTRSTAEVSIHASHRSTMADQDKAACHQPDHRATIPVIV